MIYKNMQQSLDFSAVLLCLSTSTAIYVIGEEAGVIGKVYTPLGFPLMFDRLFWS